ncbi:hypothetical protein CIG75_18875 [Tumebacillus algifaecis]|uniref:YolD-like family protein n=1 Tax=Tumebacillus algifaecis TaxID=1214604 RepID=A0A223D5C5_9BACL|nr:YolD-like family protein [Tumebacillus algifaecis]ASS76799.1 hypothetical protein CIG75_18875 [Tumebacillus algifaecis]
MQRGNKLWEGNRMILPEHRRVMIEMEIRKENFVERPVLDEHAHEEIQRTISDAMEAGSLVTLRVWKSGRIEEVSMVPKWVRVDVLKGHDLAGKVVGVELAGIVGVD